MLTAGSCKPSFAGLTPLSAYNLYMPLVHADANLQLMAGLKDNLTPARLASCFADAEPAARLHQVLQVIELVLRDCAQCPE